MSHPAVVFGATGGLGRGVCAELNRLGLAFVAHARTTSPAHEPFPGLLADLSVPSARASLCGELPPELSAVFMCFGAVGFAPLSATSDDDLRRMLELNTLAPLSLLRHLAPRLVPGSAVVFLTGAVVDHPMLGLSAYAASKSALAAALRPARREYRSLRLVDARVPHTDTPLAARPVFGSTPKLPAGLDATDVARKLVSVAYDPLQPVDLPPEFFRPAPGF